MLLVPSFAARASARVVLVYKSWQEHHGVCHVGLGVTAAYTARTLRRSGVQAEVWPCRSGKDLAARLGRAHQFDLVPPTHVVLFAPWLPTAELSELAAEHTETTFVVTSHSNVAFLTVDPDAIQLLRQAVDLQHACHNVLVGGNSEKFTRWATEAWGARFVFLPNLYSLSESAPPPRRRWKGQALRLGLFGAPRQLKNGLTAAGAAVELAVRLRVPTELHLSTAANDVDANRSIVELTSGVPNLRLVFDGWKPWQDFRRFVAQMDLLLQPSFSETFNNVTADGVAMGVPSVVSTAIDWVPRGWVADSDDASDVARVGERLLRDPRAARAGRRALDRYVARGLAAWLRFLRA